MTKRKLKERRKKEVSETDRPKVNGEGSCTPKDKEAPDRATESPDADVDDGGPLSV